MGVTYNVYMGTESCNLTKILDTSPFATMATSYLATVVGNAIYKTDYYWRVDTVNDFGITEGDEWTFKTILFNPPLTSGMSFGGGDNYDFTGTPNGENNMITVRWLVAIAKDALFYEEL